MDKQTNEQNHQVSIMQTLSAIIDSRLLANAEDSYVASLARKGQTQILKKIGEESAELVMAARDLAHHHAPTTREAVIYESADVLFHLLVLLRYEKISFEEVEAALSRRLGVSGLLEKRQRAQNQQ